MPLASIDGNKIVLTTKYVDRHLIQQLPGSRYSQGKWSTPLSWAACVTLRALFKDELELDPELVEWAWGQHQSWIDDALTLRGLDKPLPTWTEKPSDVGLLPFQRVGIRFLEVASQALLAEPCGSGKTVQAIRALHRIAHVRDGGMYRPLMLDEVFPALVVCPTGVMLGWEEEWHTWWPDIDVVVVHGSMTERRQLLAEEHQVYVTNYESLRSHSRLAGYGSLRLRRCEVCDKALPADGKHPQHRCEHCPKELNRGQFKTLILDEAHRICNPGSKQTRAAWAVADATPRKFALTGTPVVSNPADLWSIMRALSKGEYPSREKFIDLFTQKGFTFWGTLEILGLRPEMREAFFQIVDPRMRRLPKEVILPQLPPIRRSTRMVEMSAKQRKPYREMERYMAANLDGEILLAPNPLTKLGRLMQLAAACGRLEWRDVTWREIVVIDDVEQQVTKTEKRQFVELTEPSCKLDALEELLDELADEPVVVASASRKLAVLAVERLQKRHITVGLIAGGMDVYARKAVEHDYMARKIRVVVCVIDAAGEGLTLTAGRTLVYINRHWSHIKNEQMDNRVHRIGSERHSHVQIIDIVTRGTVEARQREVLAGKAERLEEIVRDRETLKRLLGDT